MHRFELGRSPAYSPELGRWLVVIDGFSQFGCRHTEVGALRNLIAHYGVKAPHTGQPYTEQFLFGVGGGLGFAYFMFERRGGHPIFIGTRVHTRETERPEYFQNIAQRIGFQAQVQNSSSGSAATGNMRKSLAGGSPLLVWTDAARLPYTGVVGFGNFYHVVIAYGLDERSEIVNLSDRPPCPVTATTQELRYARETSWSPKYRAMTIQKLEQQNDPRIGAEQGIRECVMHMNEGLGIGNFGLKGMQKWATMLTSTKEKKSWLKVLQPGADLYCSLLSIYEQIATRGDVGPAGRPFYAEFLDQAAELLDKPAIRDAAVMFRESANLWQELADAHLPDSVPLFREARDLAQERKRLFETEGPQARERLDLIRERLSAIEQQASVEFPLPASDMRGFLGDLRQRILKVRDQEARAVEQLGAAIA